MTLSLPINFGNRQADRLFVRNMSGRGVDRSELLWMMFLVWRDFGTAREDRREVPADPRERAGCDAVAILEEYIGWDKAPGEFVEGGIDSGFFLLTPTSDGFAELVLTDFFPANAGNGSVSNSVHGGVGKSFKSIQPRAERAAADQMQLFSQNGGVSIAGADERVIRVATKLVHSICMALRRQPPQQEVWKETVLAKSVEVVQSTTEADREAVLKWFIKNRSDQRIAARIDFVLDQFPSLIPEAVKAFG